MRPVIRALVTPILAAMSVAGCGDRSERPPAASVRDSADVRIVEYAELVGEVGLATRASPLVSLGGRDADPAREFFRVTSGAFLSDGSFVVVDAGSREVRRFDDAGRHLASYGAPGDGPREFRRLATVAVGRGDSIFAYDAGRRRLTVLSPQLGFAREIAFQGAYRNLEIGGALADHGLLLVDNGYPEEDEGSGFQQFHGRYVTTDPLGAEVGTIGRFPWYRLTIVESGRDVRGVRAFFDEPTTSAVSDDVVWVGTRRRAVIEGRDAAGALHTVVRWRAGDRTVRPNDIELWKRARVSDAPPEQRDAVRARMDEAPFSEAYPTHGRLLPGQGGAFWVEEYRRPTAEGPTRWWGFARDGALRSSVRLPEGAMALAMLDERVLVVERDELDVELVRVYELVRDGEGR